MSRVTAEVLIDRILGNADFDYSSPVGRPQVLYFVNESMSELYDILIGKFDQYFIAQNKITINTSDQYYPLPDDFYKLLAVYYIDSSNDRYFMDTFRLQELDRYNDTSLDNRYLRYRILGTDFHLNKLPSGTGTMELWYVPQCQQLRNESDEIAISIPCGWEEYLIVDCVAKCLAKVETDNVYWLTRKAEAKARIESTSSSRDKFEVLTVRDGYRRW
jgi:hypothetical protein